MANYNYQDLLFIDKVKEDKQAFGNKVIQISNELGINPNWLMAVMKSESGLNPQEQNTVYLVQGEPATGLIQFIKSTAESLGTTTTELHSMTGVQQLDYVKKYYDQRMFRGKLLEFADLYRATFYPYSLGKGDDYIFGSEKSDSLVQSIVASNPIIDTENGVITNSSFREWALGKVPEPWRTQFRGEVMDSAKKWVSRNSKHIGAGILFISAALVLVYFLYIRKKKNGK